jgi:hypothetical protein
MENEFVTYEIALRMKQLGFDEPCFGYYSFKGELTETKVFRQDHYTNQSALAPLFQQAFRWFREKYTMFPKIQVYLGEDIDRFKGEFAHFWEIDFLNSYCEGDKPFKTYEEAELACLTKLIEIVEEKQK